MTRSPSKPKSKHTPKLTTKTESLRVPSVQIPATIEHHLEQPHEILERGVRVAVARRTGGVSPPISSGGWGF